jgi:hypothetical protein
VVQFPVVGQFYLKEFLVRRNPLGVEYLGAHHFPAGVMNIFFHLALRHTASLASAASVSLRFMPAMQVRVHLPQPVQKRR